MSVFALHEAALTAFSEFASSVFKSLITMVTSVVCFVLFLYKKDGSIKQESTM